jgi:hypothetical protein
VVIGFVCFLFGVGCGASSGASSTPAASSGAAPTVVPAPAQAAPAPAATQGSAAQHEAGTIPQGEWLVGDEVAPGRYRSMGAVEGIIELCSASTRSENGDVMEWKTGNAGEQVILTVTEKAVTVTNSGCEPFTPVG